MKTTKLDIEIKHILCFEPDTYSFYLFGEDFLEDKQCHLSNTGKKEESE